MTRAGYAPVREAFKKNSRCKTCAALLPVLGIFSMKQGLATGSLQIKPSGSGDENDCAPDEDDRPSEQTI